ncbi:MAG: hypothetical protein WCY62_11120 [Clostridia bacterium]
MTGEIMTQALHEKILFLCDKYQIDAECILNIGSEFTEQILNDLVQQGYEGQILLDKFKETSRQMRPAAEVLMAEADDIAKTGKGTAIHELLDTNC